MENRDLRVRKIRFLRDSLSLLGLLAKIKCSIYGTPNPSLTMKNNMDHLSGFSWGLGGGERGWEERSVFLGFPWWLSGKESTYNPGDMGSIPGSGRSPGGGNGNSL